MISVISNMKENVKMGKTFKVRFYCGKEQTYAITKEYPYGISQKQIEADFQEYLAKINTASNWELAEKYEQGMVQEIDRAFQNSNKTTKTAINCVTIYADGACSGNPGPGGWGAILRVNGHEKELSGGEKDTTNNRMELTSVIMGLSALKKPCNVTVVTDSKYVADAIGKGWLKKWKTNGWRKSDKKPVLNKDLWEKLDELLQKHTVVFNWVEGHAGHPENERCDTLAVAQAQKFKQS